MRYASFSEFYPYYLSEHRDRTNRRLHFVGSGTSLLIAATALVLREPAGLLLALLVGYGCAWIGHFYFERNRPATFRHPLHSFAGDWVMFRDILVGRIPF